MEPVSTSAGGKTIDVPQVLKPDVEKRLLRIFTALRQHDRKSRLARRVAELSSIRSSTSRARAIQQEEAGREEEKQEKEEEEETEQEREEEEQQAGDFAQDEDLRDAQVQWIIWEADDNLDGCIDWDEFRGAFARTVVDRQNVEPNQLYYLTHFMLCHSDNSTRVSVGDLQSELQRIPGADHLVARIKRAFGEQACSDGERKCTLSEFFAAMLSDLPDVACWAKAG
ncbi:hypothetical protein P43SY_004007 [Pythium insidiosum]|uniref:EF-hand domain-containing protein n=1 Tax=Pythium insidiosum TaxID=114742 RepID=A0AAD5Q533_PYTIN|nr:hypothetical protein P43SY_004007 [Pythium insidiosum]